MFVTKVNLSFKRSVNERPKVTHDASLTIFHTWLLNVTLLYVKKLTYPLTKVIHKHYWHMKRHLSKYTSTHLYFSL